MNVKTMKASLILSKQGEVGFFYGEDLEIIPEWVQVDAERGEIYVYDAESNCTALHMEPMSTKTYEKIVERQAILLVQVEDNDISKPVKAIWVPLSVSQQI